MINKKQLQNLTELIKLELNANQLNAVATGDLTNLTDSEREAVEKVLEVKEQQLGFQGIEFPGVHLRKN